MICIGSSRVKGSRNIGSNNLSLFLESLTNDNKQTDKPIDRRTHRHCLLIPTFNFQVSTWSKQYFASATRNVEAMTKLIFWLQSNIPEDNAETGAEFVKLVPFGPNIAFNLTGNFLNNPRP